MYNDARGSGPFTTNPYLHLQWGLIALDWLYQRHFCFLPRIYCKKSASSIHAVPLAQLGVIKFVFLLDFPPPLFFHWTKISGLIRGGCSHLQSSTESTAESKQWRAAYKKRMRWLFWGVFFVVVFLLPTFIFVRVWNDRNEIQNGTSSDTDGTQAEGNLWPRWKRLTKDTTGGDKPDRDVMLTNFSISNAVTTGYTSVIYMNSGGVCSESQSHSVPLLMRLFL